MLDLTASIRFSSVLPKKAWIILRKSSTDLIWMAWSGFGQTHLVWKQASAGIRGPGFWQDATGPLPVSNFWTQFCLSTDDPDNIVQKPAQIRFSSGCLCQVLAKRIRSGSQLVCKNHPTRFWPNGSSPEASWCARIIRPAFGQMDPVQKPACVQESSDPLLAKGIRSRSQPVCKNHPVRFWPMLPTWSGPDANQIQHVYRDWTIANKGSRESPQKWTLKRHFISTAEGYFHGTQCLKKGRKKRRLLTVKERVGLRGEKSMI